MMFAMQHLCVASGCWRHYKDELQRRPEGSWGAEGCMGEHGDCRMAHGYKRGVEGYRRGLRCRGVQSHGGVLHGTGNCRGLHNVVGVQECREAHCV